VVERAIILTQGTTLEVSPLHSITCHESKAPRPDDLTTINRAHVWGVLDATSWVAAGPDGAAARLGMRLLDAQLSHEEARHPAYSKPVRSRSSGDDSILKPCAERSAWADTIVQSICPPGERICVAHPSESDLHKPVLLARGPT
jgi:hypothetical protein